MNKLKWTKVDQALWRVFEESVMGFYRIGWITREEGGEIINLMDRIIEKRVVKDEG